MSAAASSSAAPAPLPLGAAPLPEAPAEGTHEAGVDAVHQELSQYRYCTVFMIEGEELDSAALESELDPLGDSLLVVGDSTAGDSRCTSANWTPRGAVVNRSAPALDNTASTAFDLKSSRF